MIASIPLQAIPNQRVTTIINQQQITLDLLTRGDRGLFADIYLGANLIIAGVKCNNLTLLNQYPTTLEGYLYFKTLSGRDPVYTNFGTNDILYYSDTTNELDTLYNDWVANNG